MLAQVELINFFMNNFQLQKLDNGRLLARRNIAIARMCIVVCVAKTFFTRSIFSKITELAVQTVSFSVPL